MQCHIHLTITKKKNFLLLLSGRLKEGINTFREK